MECMMVALTSVGNICILEAGRVSAAYVFDLSLWKVCCHAGPRNVGQWVVSTRILIECIKTDICVFVHKCRGIINLCGKFEPNTNPQNVAIVVHIFVLFVI
jgi:hypothetical protein